MKLLLVNPKSNPGAPGQNRKWVLAMKRALCIWLPHWPLQRVLAARPELKDRAVVLYETPRQGGLRVVACSPSAQVRGVVPGMPLAEATAVSNAQISHRSDFKTASLAL